MSPEVRNVILGVRWLLDDPARWCQGTSFGPPNRGEVPIASCCLTAAVALVSGRLFHGHAEIVHVKEALSFLRCGAGLRPGPFLHRWNDAAKRDHADVLALLDRVLGEG